MGVCSDSTGTLSGSSCTGADGTETSSFLAQPASVSKDSASKTEIHRFIGFFLSLKLLSVYTSFLRLAEKIDGYLKISYTESNKSQ
jgi:hypothetical protein